MGNAPETPEIKLMSSESGALAVLAMALATPATAPVLVAALTLSTTVWISAAVGLAASTYVPLWSPEV